MVKIWLFFGLAALIPVFVWMRAMLRRRRRARRRTTPLPDAWQEILRRNLSVYPRLPDDVRRQLDGHIQVLLAEKQFIGGGGLQMTDEIRVTVAGQAAMLLLNRPTQYYPDLRTIVVYPRAYKAPEVKVHGGVVVESDSVRAGESWVRGSVVLAWDHVRGGARSFHDGHNVVLHEFAHQLDQEDGVSDGTPILPKRSDYLVWTHVCRREFADLKRRVSKHRQDLLDAYGATDPAEFFAVATESFFEQPERFRRLHSELYDALRDYYRLDPETWEAVG